ncbi:sarcosine oxidase subunit delta [Pelagovum pacificum]|uniref:Sarcosine oxidase subunit delta n=1 Tax=Pelagovum pacificum TaxID=2588711 RepID=A0A5C5GI15_9RHOB|nr:sarcosine oxidase subunit delta [Pelagovum pacificum]QQA43785.1 sarcosine oxidase subunit delta [Pelagovum pacificum]TNY33086.1 sarcosine oxidase subunit delta [Pelagovum pacificum]
MRIPCPHCGARDRREFTYKGADLAAPGGTEWSDAWDDYLHLRDNPAGELTELWYHDPCGTWVSVRRDTVSHAVIGSAAASAGRPS